MGTNRPPGRLEASAYRTARQIASIWVGDVQASPEVIQMFAADRLPTPHDRTGIDMSHPDETHGSDGFERKPRSQGMDAVTAVALGCGCLVVVALLGVAATTFWVANNLDRMVAGATKAVIEGVGLPDDQEQRILARIDELAEQIRNGEISEEEGGAIIKNILEGPILPAAISLGVIRGYIDESGLDDEEKQAGRTAVYRLTHGAIYQMIPQEKLDPVLDHISTRKANNQREFRQSLSDDEVRAFIAAAKEAAGEAGVPEDLPEINFADEFDKAVDKALGMSDEVEPEAVIEAEPDGTSESP